MRCAFFVYGKKIETTFASEWAVIRGFIRRLFVPHAFLVFIMTLLHCPPVRQQAAFKITVLLHAFIHFGLPKYFENCVEPYQLYANTLCSVACKKYLEISFLTARSTDLLDHVRLATTISSFRKKLKAYLFCEAYPS